MCFQGTSQTNQRELYNQPHVDIRINHRLQIDLSGGAPERPMASKTMTLCHRIHAFVFVSHITLCYE